MLKFFWSILALLAALSVLDTAEASVFAKSTKSECVLHGEEGAELKTKDGNACKQKLVVALTVTSNEGKAQAIEANIARVLDKTEKQVKNVQLKNPVRIRINKSPMIVNYRLYQVGNVHNYPHEQPRRKSTRHCRDDWYANREAVCGYAYDSAGQKIFDSQGFCCYCNVAENNKVWRGQIVNCLNQQQTNLGHCLVFDDYRYFVFGLYPPEQKFTITITIEQLAYSRKEGDDVWTPVSTLEIGPHKRIAKSEDFSVKAEYIADFNPSMYVESAKLAHTYVMIPDQNSITKRLVYQGQLQTELNAFLRSLSNVSEWMTASKEMFDFTGSTCNKIGIGYAGFRYQSGKCTTPVGSCLENQPFLLWKKEKELQSQGTKGQHMLYNFGKLHSIPHSQGLIDYQINFLADRPTKSIVMLSMVADDIKTVVHKSPGRIVEAYIEAFEALAMTGDLMVIVQNTGSLTASYNIFVVHCSAGIDMVPSKMVTLDPNQMANVTFTIHSFHAIGKINYCKAELYDVSSELLDNITVSFETLDTCFCYGHCGCACGNDTTNCPPPPPIANGTSAGLWNINDLLPPWLSWLPQLFRTETAVTFAFLFWIVFLLWCLGNIKIIHMIITGQIDFPMVTEPIMIVLSIVKGVLMKLFKEFLPEQYDACVTCCEKSIMLCCAKMFCCLTFGRAQTNDIEIAVEKKVGRGWRRPRHCNGMCAGAKGARRRHRKQMRINKRKGMKSDIPWFQKPYTCTCQVKDTMPCCEICKGMFFFFYCPLLPLFWVLEYIWVFAKQKWRRHKRKKRFRELRAAKQKEKDKTYLLLDKYSRGKVERQILDFSKDLKIQRQQKKKEEIKGFNPDIKDIEKLGATDEDKPSQEESSSDTTDADEAGDMEELLNPGDPVYFNYATNQNTPPSLINPGKSFSIKGRLVAITTETNTMSYKFELHSYSKQVKQVLKGKLCLLKPPKQIESSEFEHKLDSATVPKLITLSPLFPCLNN